MISRIVIFGLAMFALASALAEEPRTSVIIVAGAPGDEQYAPEIQKWAANCDEAAERAGAKHLIIGRNGSTNALFELRAALTNETKESTADLWLILLGHGTFDGREAKFNLAGPDLSATELADLLKPFHRPLAVINTTSASGAFLKKLSAEGRVIVTATKNGNEQNYSRFGKYFSEALADPEADLDKDGQTSLLEAFLMASRRVAEFYKTEGRLATEHALIDDNGDGLGTLADWFRGVRPIKKPEHGDADGIRAHQYHLIKSDAEQKLSPETRARRDQLERDLAVLRDSKSQYSEEEYFSELEKVLLELGRLYQSAATNQVNEAKKP